jgi:rhomboid family GlyGly-CTERM serine protease
MTRFLTSATCKIWLPWSLLLLLTGVLQWTGGYPALRLALPATDNSWLYTGLTCHLVHLSSRHWLYNALALIVIAAYFARFYTWRQWLLTYCLSALCISAGLLWFPQGLHSYAGLSGVLHGLFAMGCLRLAASQPKLALGLGLLLLVKLLLETRFGSVLMPTPGFPVAHMAHVYGVIGGVLSWVCVYVVRQRR